MPRLKAVPKMVLYGAVCGTGVLHGFAQGSGTLNYSQGQVSVNGVPVHAEGVAPLRRLAAGEVLATGNGSADVLLAPGALLRVGQNTSVEMVAEGAERSEVRLSSGRADVAVNVVSPKRLLLVDLPGGQAQIRERGLYDFDAAPGTMRVFNGEANAYPGVDTDAAVKAIRVKEQHEISFNGDRPKALPFDRDLAETDLLPWSGPQETGAAFAGSAVREANYGDYGYGAGAPEAYGFAGAGYGGFGGWGYPYGFYGYPYGFYGYPYGPGLGFFGGGTLFYGPHPVLPPRGPAAGHAVAPPRGGAAGAPAGGIGAIRGGHR